MNWDMLGHLWKLGEKFRIPEKKWTRQSTFRHLFTETASPYDVEITLLTPFPGTPLYARLAREGRIRQAGAWHLCTLFDVNHQPAGMTPQELREGIYWLGEQLYGDEATRHRRKGFFTQLKQERIPA